MGLTALLVVAAACGGRTKLPGTGGLDGRAPDLATDAARLPDGGPIPDLPPPTDAAKPDSKPPTPDGPPPPDAKPPGPDAPAPDKPAPDGPPADKADRPPPPPDAPPYDLPPPPDAYPYDLPKPDGYEAPYADVAPPDSPPKFDAPAPDSLPPGSVTTGGACSGSEDCASESGSALCLPASVGFPAGYCAAECDVAKQNCPGWAQCVPTDSGGLCLASCDPGGAGDCRPGYLCVDPGFPLRPVCFPGCLNDAGCAAGLECDIPPGFPYGSCFDPSAKIGQACDAAFSCPAGGVCISEKDFGYPYGMCLGAPCDIWGMDSCPSGSVCGFGADGAGRCAPSCKTDADCRTGYRCGKDGGSGELVCQPRCTVPSHCSNKTCHIGTGLC